MLRMIELLARLDLYERLDALTKALLVGPSWRFTVPRDQGWSGHQIEELLREYGVRIWGRSFDRDHLYFRVKERQANWAEYLLWRHGIPVFSRPFNARNQWYGTHDQDTVSSGQPDAHHTGWLDAFLSLFF